MRIMRRFAGLGAALLFTMPMFPCNMVDVNALRSPAVREISGTVIGSGRYDRIGVKDDEQRRMIVVRGATVVVRIRIDLPQDPAYAASRPPPWKCAEEVARTTTNDSGDFSVQELRPGNYCLQINGPRPRPRGEAELRGAFFVTIASDAPKAVLVADITPLWPDCRGGASLTLKPKS